jgi:hypothetical protein
MGQRKPVHSRAPGYALKVSVHTVSLLVASRKVGNKTWIVFYCTNNDVEHSAMGWRSSIPDSVVYEVVGTYPTLNTINIFK